jgi:hypothetical protein
MMPSHSKFVTKVNCDASVFMFYSSSFFWASLGSRINHKSINRDTLSFIGLPGAWESPALSRFGQIARLIDFVLTHYEASLECMVYVSVYIMYKEKVYFSNNDKPCGYGCMVALYDDFDGSFGRWHCIDYIILYL